ncbi:hypothetical protein L226DRAFT_577036, partial [Lentinus tigrinus ALCF2SS1-7]|uniref:uncharacterized protein n=1 Tax=Lentinus tigrinus ALCF2SS1-7 TaxID=1328758 RepID=UPI0011660567
MYIARYDASSDRFIIATGLMNEGSPSSVIIWTSTVGGSIVSDDSAEYADTDDANADDANADADADADDADADADAVEVTNLSSRSTSYSHILQYFAGFVICILVAIGTAVIVGEDLLEGLHGEDLVYYYELYNVVRLSIEVIKISAVDLASLMTSSSVDPPSSDWTSPTSTSVDHFYSWLSSIWNPQPTSSDSTSSAAVTSNSPSMSDSAHSTITLAPANGSDSPPFSWFFNSHPSSSDSFASASRPSRTRRSPSLTDPDEPTRRLTIATSTSSPADTKTTQSPLPSGLPAQIFPAKASKYILLTPTAACTTSLGATYTYETRHVNAGTPLEWPLSLSLSLSLTTTPPAPSHFLSHSPPMAGRNTRRKERKEWERKERKERKEREEKSVSARDKSVSAAFECVAYLPLNVGTVPSSLPTAATPHAQLVLSKDDKAFFDTLFHTKE